HRAQRLEMAARFLVQVLGQPWRALDERLHLRILAVEDAQRIAFEAPAAVGIELRFVLAEVLHQPRTIGLARLRRPERIDFETHAGDAERAPQPRGERDQLRIDVRTCVTDGLHVDLPELAIAALLRALVPEHRPDAPELVALPAQHAVRDHRAHDARGSFGPQREALSALVGKGVHLVLDHIRELADRTLEKLRVLDDGHADFLVTVGREQLARGPLQVLPEPNL